MPTPRNLPPTTVADVLLALVREPGRPRVTWYGDDGERVELSGAVLDNWVSKTTNLLVEELDAAPGTRVRVDLPPHWRTVVWSLAAWRAGACVVLDGDDAPADVVVTDDPGRHPGAPDLVAVALPALARTFPGELPPGALDAAASVMTYGDVLGVVPPRAGSSPALTGAAVTAAGAALRHDDLLDAARDALAAGDVDVAAPGRVALPAAGATATVLLRALGVLAGGGSVVLLAPAVRQDEARLERVLAGEQVTVVLP